jgi:hypothetical protein
MFVGQGSLSQPLRESDLMRERVSNNIGETGRSGKRPKACRHKLAVHKIMSRPTTLGEGEI